MTKVSLDMTKVVSVLTTVWFFTGLRIQTARFHSQRSRRGGLFVRQKFLCRNFWLKMEGGLCTGGHIGHYTKIIVVRLTVYLSVCNGVHWK